MDILKIGFVDDYMVIAWVLSGLLLLRNVTLNLNY